MKTLMATTTMLAFMTVPALAEDAPIDTDGDGLVSLVELQAAFPEATEEAFTIADTDADGMLSPDELLAAQEAGTLPLGDA